MTYDQDIAAALHAALPPKFHADIPVLVQVLTAARDGRDAAVVTENLQAALQTLQGKTLDAASGNITIGNVSGEGIAIGHGAQATVIRIYVPRTAEQKTAWRNRSRMLEKVRTYWIEGFLQQSLHKVALIELGMQYHPDALEHPWEMLVQSPDRPRTPVPPGTTIAEVYDELGGELLILGSPGTGKTTMLLELTRTLIERAQQDETHAIPVVFNLSSWAVKRSSLDIWLVEELNARYDVPHKVARAWIENDQMLPLLDGLDEVAAAHRTACVEAINAYREQHGLTGMGVCSRIGDYEVLAQKLRLQGAVLLRTLTEQQIEEALQQIGDKADTIRTVLRQLRDNARQYDDAAAEELTRTPLLLSITTLAYQGNTDTELPPPNAPPAKQQRHLFATYVDRMFKRRGQSKKYTPEQTKHWLSWLAGRMVEQKQTVFHLEQMQPHWLDRWWQRGSYVCFSSVGGAGGFAVAGVPMGMVIMLMWYLCHYVVEGPTEATLHEVVFLGIACGFLSGLLGLIIGFLVGLGHWTNRWRQRWQPLVYGALMYGLIVGPAATVGLLTEREQIISWIVLAALPPGLITGFLVSRGQIGLIMSWSWETLRSRWYIVTGVVAATLLVYMMVYVPIYGLGKTLIETISEGLEIGATYAIVYGIGAALIVGQANVELQEKRSPHEAIWRSCRQALWMWLPIVAFVIYFIGIIRNMEAALIFSIIIAVSAGVYFGGLAFVQHFAVRLTCTLYRYAPWNYICFLNHATERIFLRNVGGGYIFVHRALLEYFADANYDRD